MLQQSTSAFISRRGSFVSKWLIGLRPLRSLRVGIMSQFPPHPVTGPAHSKYSSVPHCHILFIYSLIINQSPCYLGSCLCCHLLHFHYIHAIYYPTKSFFIINQNMCNISYSDANLRPFTDIISHVNNVIYPPQVLFF